MTTAQTRRPPPVRFSWPIYKQLTEIKTALERDRDRAVTYTEVVEYLLKKELT